MFTFNTKHLKSCCCLKLYTFHSLACAQNNTMPTEYKTLKNRNFFLSSECLYFSLCFCVYVFCCCCFVFHFRLIPFLYSIFDYHHHIALVTPIDLISIRRAVSESMSMNMIRKFMGLSAERNKQKMSNLLFFPHSKQPSSFLSFRTLNWWRPEQSDGVA